MALSKQKIVDSLQDYKHVLNDIKTMANKTAVDNLDEAAKELMAVRLSKYVRAFGLMAPVFVALVGPPLMLYKYKRSGMNKTEVSNLVNQEASNQFVTVVAHVTSFLTFTRMGNWFFAKKSIMNPKLVEPAVTLLGNLGGFCGFAFVRPIVGATIFKKFLHKDLDVDAEVSQEAIINATRYQPVSRIGRPNSLTSIGEADNASSFGFQSPPAPMRSLSSAERVLVQSQRQQVAPMPLVSSPAMQPQIQHVQQRQAVSTPNAYPAYPRVQPYQQQLPYPNQQQPLMRSPQFVPQAGYPAPFNR